ncbi:MAG: dTMP kinase [Candidatus Omnitrophica bacterium]|nr:dTMP kinase [Candidatus Omnitrophota bacterium]
MKKMKRKAFFITLEGLEASGKSSVISFLQRHFKKEGFSVKIFREPGSTKVGEELRRMLLDKKSKISKYTELLLYVAARTQLIEEKLKSSLEKYDMVICDRFYDSTIAYQRYGLKLGKIAEKTVRLFTLGINPDLTILLDSDVKKSLGRVKNKDRIESRPMNFHQRLRRGYKAIAREEPGRVEIVNSRRDLKTIYEDVKNLVTRRLEKRGRKNEKTKDEV